MTSDEAIRFRCPRCITTLKAPASQAGMRRRCPRCQLLLNVPTQSRMRASADEYPLCEAAENPVAARQHYLTVVCDLCHTRMYATEDQVGQEMVCPDCRKVNVVRPPAEEMARKRAPTAPLEEYGLCEEVTVHGDGARTPEAKQFPVYCQLCHTLMYATAEQVGQLLTCPDCGTQTPVHPPPPPPERTSADFRVAPTEEYAVQETLGQPPADSVAYQPHVGFKCRRCGTRLHATLDQVGRLMDCPDCGTTNEVPPAPPPRRKHDPRDEIDGEYVAGRAVERKEYQPFLLRRAGRGLGRDLPGVPVDRPKPPRWPFLSGIFHFPLYAGVSSVWIGFSFAAVVPVGLLHYALTTNLAGGMGLMASLEYAVVMLARAVATVLSVLWAAAAAMHLLVILWETAAGNDKIYEWPGTAFIDYILDFFYMTNALFIGAVPGFALGWYLGDDGPGWPVTTAASAYLLFPILLLSMLESSSAFYPISRLVWRSLFVVPVAWVLFYVEATLTAIVAAALVGVFFHFAPAAGIYFAPFPAVACLIIYFRLLGRLGWCCTRAFADEGK